MLEQKEIETIRKYYFERGYRLSHIAKIMCLSINTVKKYIQQDYVPIVPKNKGTSQMSNYIPTITKWLKEDKKYHYKQRHTAKRVYDRLISEYAEFDSSYSSVTKVYNEIKNQVYSSPMPEEKNIISQPRPGECKVEIKKIPYIINNKLVKGSVMIVIFPYSNAKFIQLLPDSNEESLLNALTDVFFHIKGTPHTITFCRNTNFIYVYNKKYNNRTFTELYLKFKLHYDFKDCFMFGLYKNTFIANQVVKEALIDTSDFLSITDCNKHLLENSKINQKMFSKMKCPILALFKEDQAAFIPLPERLILDKYIKRRVNKFGYINIESNQYFLPQRYKDFLIYVRYLPENFEFYTLSGDLICSHQRIYQKENTKVIDWNDYIKTLINKPNALLHCELLLYFPYTLLQYVKTMKGTCIREFIINLNKLVSYMNINKAILVTDKLYKDNKEITDEIIDEYIRINYAKEN